MRRRGRETAIGLFSGTAVGRKGTGHRRFRNCRDFKSPDFATQYPNLTKERSKLSFDSVGRFKSFWNEEKTQTTYKSPQDSVKKGINPVAHIDENKCAGCGACESECPLNAIIVDVIAYVNDNICTGCGICASVCPMDAITIL
ncbi:MAG: 4Fe-4S binding protein [Candidatus Marinimicrobia bacterium]|nr:4Fe-4S binding protein [Candidatus Neomarinimicrobiota bacterium]